MSILAVMDVSFLLLRRRFFGATAVRGVMCRLPIALRRCAAVVEMADQYVVRITVDSIFPRALHSLRFGYAGSIPVGLVVCVDHESQHVFDALHVLRRTRKGSGCTVGSLVHRCYQVVSALPVS